MADIASTALSLLRLYGPLALALFVFLEASMLFPFLPSEVVAPAAAALLVEGPASFLAFVTAAGVGGTVGAYLLYAVFRDPRDGDAHWLRDRVHVADDRVERMSEWFRRWGGSSVLWGRFLPGLRSVISVPAGLAGMGRGRFTAYTAVGTVGFYAAVGAVVYYGRERSLFAAAAAFVHERPLLALVGGAVVLTGGALVRRVVSRSRLWMSAE